MIRIIKKIWIYVLLILLFPLSLLISGLSADNPDITEQIYSRHIYPVISGAVGAVTGLIPFCAAELILVLAAFGILFILIRFIVNAIRLRRINLKGIIRFLLTAVSVFCAGYFLFTVMWGLNYNRNTLIDNLGYKSGTVTADELSAVLKNEINDINTLCNKITFNSNRHSAYSGGVTEMQTRVNNGFITLSERNSIFSANAAHPKAVVLSVFMSYAGIEGIFIPFTFEPCVNTDCPEFVLAFNMAHESAHYKGFAREDEANFVAYLANSLNSDVYFRYSAHMIAYIYLSNALYATDSGLWNSIASKLDSRAASDIQYNNDYVNRYSGTIQQISDKVNDSYLKSQGQEQGVASYSLFVNLLCAKYRTENRAG